MQNAVDRILESAVETPSSWDFKREQTVDKPDEKSPAKQLAIEDRSYFAVSATLSCLKALESYLKIVVNLPLLSTDVMSRIIEFLKVSTFFLFRLRKYPAETFLRSNTTQESVRWF